MTPQISQIASVIIGLGNEGVPIRAITRATKVASEEVRETLHGAIQKGIIIQMPREDWQARSTTENRDLEVDTFEMLADEKVTHVCSRVYGTTQLQSMILVAMIKRKEVTRSHLHTLIESRRCVQKNETNIKMVDVVVCHIRNRLRKLKPKIEIVTQWSTGYFIAPEDRKKMREAILARHLSPIP